ncbi:hypothetical protein VP01_1592g2 [Puccinia sorghi]|uniref:Uncharacterized protein n=1 Tax=Puccinia sorghi TaxID=27349 RepID=A0A0L6VHM6_9BASI|nr:hypothetical protein VP01_1592g2 [Puccinia sorghi]
MRVNEVEEKTEMEELNRDVTCVTDWDFYRHLTGILTPSRSSDLCDSLQLLMYPFPSDKDLPLSESMPCIKSTCNPIVQQRPKLMPMVYSYFLLFSLVSMISSTSKSGSCHSFILRPLLCSTCLISLLTTTTCSFTLVLTNLIQGPLLRKFNTLQKIPLFPEIPAYSLSDLLESMSCITSVLNPSYPRESNPLESTFKIGNTQLPVKFTKLLSLINKNVLRPQNLQNCNFLVFLNLFKTACHWVTDAHSVLSKPSHGNHFPISILVHCGMPFGGKILNFIFFIIFYGFIYMYHRFHKYFFYAHGGGSSLSLEHEMWEIQSLQEACVGSIQGAWNNWNIPLHSLSDIIVEDMHAINPHLLVSPAETATFVYKSGSPRSSSQEISSAQQINIPSFTSVEFMSTIYYTYYKTGRPFTTSDQCVV